MDDLRGTNHLSAGLESRGVEVTSLRVTSDGLHVSVLLCRLKSARDFGVSTYLFGGRVGGKRVILERGHLEWSIVCVLQWF